MSKEFQIRDGNLIASFDLENEDGDIDFCKLLKVSHGVADEIGMFVDYVATNKIIKDQSKRISDLEAKLAEKDDQIKILKNDLCELQDKKVEIFIKGQEMQLKEYNEKLAEKEKLLEINERILRGTKLVKQELEQDKISFAVEQLEKVLDTMDTDMGRDVGDIIVCQIKQLKEK